MMRALIASTLVGLLVAACAAEDSTAIRRGSKEGDDSSDPNVDPNDPNGPSARTPDGTTPGAAVPGACEALPHVGFAKQDFVADRKPGDIGTNRRRVKPFSSLTTEFKRALGVAPAALAGNVAAYGDVPARWYAEPAEGAVSLYTTYTLAFSTCYDTMTGADFQTAPTDTTATTQCATMQRKFWQRTPSADETKACADLATGMTTEPVARRRWAHACASILTATGFTTY